MDYLYGDRFSKYFYVYSYFWFLFLTILLFQWNMFSLLHSAHRRVLTSKCAGVDTYLALAALLLHAFLMGVNCYGLVNNAIGGPAYGSRVRALNFYWMFYWHQMFSTLAVQCARSSLLLTARRVSTSRLVRVAALTLLGCTAAYSVIFLVGATVLQKQFIPIWAFYQNSPGFGTATAVLDLLINLTAVGFAVPAVLSMNLGKRRTSGLVCVILLGILAVGSSGGRIFGVHRMERVLNDDDVGATIGLFHIFLWSTVECFAVLQVAALPNSVKVLLGQGCINGTESTTGLEGGAESQPTPIRSQSPP